MSITVPTQASAPPNCTPCARPWIMLKKTVMHAVSLIPAADVVANVRVVLAAAVAGM